MRTLLKVIKTSELDPEAGKARSENYLFLSIRTYLTSSIRPDQLVLQDDPAFLPDIDLPSLDLDLSLFENSTQGSSHRASIMSASSQQSSKSSNKDGEASVLGLILPTSDSGNASGIGGFQLARSGSNATGIGHRVAEVFSEEQGFFPDVDFNFDAEGNMIELEAPQPVQSEEHVSRARRGSELSARMRQDNEDGLMTGHLQVLSTPLILLNDPSN